MLNLVRASNCVMLLSVRSEKSASPGVRAVARLLGKWLYRSIVIPVGRNAAVRRSSCVFGYAGAPRDYSGRPLDLGKRPLRHCGWNGAGLNWGSLLRRLIGRASDPKYHLSSANYSIPQ